MKKSLPIALLLFFTVALSAAEQSLQVQKDEIWNIARLYKQDNTKRSLRLPPAPKAKINKIIHRAYTAKKTAGAAAVPAAAISTQPNVYNFSATTAWGTFNAEVIEYPGKPYFDVTFEAQHPIQGMVIRDGPRKLDIYTAYYNDIKAPDAPIRINYAYQTNYLMILKANIDGEIQPQIIALFNRNVVKSAQ